MANTPSEGEHSHMGNSSESDWFNWVDADASCATQLQISYYLTILDYVSIYKAKKVKNFKIKKV